MIPVAASGNHRSPLAVASALGTTDKTDCLASAVDPMIGTDFTGNTYPGAQAPFGMVGSVPTTDCPAGTG